MPAIEGERKAVQLATPRDVAAAEAIQEAYDSEARASGYLAPDIALGLVYEYLRPGESILDLGIGTGLVAVLFRKAGLQVAGVDLDPDMLAVCRRKGFEDLALHDLLQLPYPYPSESFDHVACIGVIPFLSDPSPVFAETGRLLKASGTFVFLTLDQGEEESPDFSVEPQPGSTEARTLMYRHSAHRVEGWLRRFGFEPLKSVPFPVYRDRERTVSMRARCYVARKTVKHGQATSGAAVQVRR